MIINDISKLSESLNSLGLDNLNYILENKNIKMIWNSQNNTYQINREFNINDINSETEFIIDKIFVISNSKKLIMRI